MDTSGIAGAVVASAVLNTILGVVLDGIFQGGLNIKRNFRLEKIKSELE